MYRLNRNGSHIVETINSTREMPTLIHLNQMKWDQTTKRNSREFGRGDSPLWTGCKWLQRASSQHKFAHYMRIVDRCWGWPRYLWVEIAWNICVNSRMAFRYFCEKIAQTIIDRRIIPRSCKPLWISSSSIFKSESISSKTGEHR